MMDITRIKFKGQITELSDFAGDIWREYYSPLIGVEQVEYMLETFQSPDAIERQIKEGYEYYLMGEEEIDIGYAAIKYDPAGHALFISKFYLIKYMRGKGYGKMLMDFIINRAKIIGAKKIWLTVNKKNLSVEIYKKMGFLLVDEFVQDIGSGFVMDDYKMEMTL